MHRTTILFDDETLAAAREVAACLRTTTSEAVRQSVVRYRDQLRGVPSEFRRQRVAALQELHNLFEGHDVEAELAQRKLENEHF